jgi:hypothetical protein
MCTVSWLHEEDGLHLLCNRDEKKSRRPAGGPGIHAHRGVRFIAPRDAERGGTWIAVNEFGLVLCLLNAPGPQATRTRGRVVWDLAAATGIEDASERLAAVDMSSTSAFTLAMVELRRPAIVARWNGFKLALGPAGHVPLTSSSFDSQAVCDARLRQFDRIAGAAGRFDAAALHAFHRSHEPEPGAYSTCMHRDDAETVSFSWITVGVSAIHFSYSPSAPCQLRPAETVRLARR